MSDLLSQPPGDPKKDREGSGRLNFVRNGNQEEQEACSCYPLFRPVHSKNRGVDHGGGAVVLALQES